MPVRLQIKLVETAILPVDLPTYLLKLQILLSETAIAISTGSIAMCLVTKLPFLLVEIAIVVSTSKIANSTSKIADLASRNCDRHLYQ